jgi:hypothetical protein
MKLTGLIIHNNSTVQITVDYDESTNTPGEVTSIWISGEKGKSLNVTDLFNEMLTEELELMLKKIDWVEEYRNATARKRRAA